MILNFVLGSFERNQSFLNNNFYTNTMEVLDGYVKELQKTFKTFHREDVKSFEEYESEMRASIESQVAPGMKKQRTSLEEDQDSGVDATTVTTSTRASTATSSSTAGNTRPSRSAKTAASGNLKLPKLGTKLRQEIKLERITETSSISTNSNKSDAKENDFNSLNIKREKLSVGIRSQTNDIDDRDSSILVIPNEVNIITLSDDDDDDDGHSDNNKMPPPMIPAPKKLPTKKTRSNQKNSALIESDATEASSPQNNEAPNVEQKKMKKVKKTKKPVLPMVEVKQEKGTEEFMLENGDIAAGKTTGDKKIPEKAGSKNATMESVYEDASDKITPPSTKTLPVSATYVLPTKSVKENGAALKVDNVGKTKTSFSSIITEDNSDDELPIYVPKNNIKHKELFNPCVQSPMKTKVAAFEKQLQDFSSPVPPVRQTRTKTRQLAKQNSEISTSSTGNTHGTSKLPKPSTPSVELRHPVKEHTPLGKTKPPMKTYSAYNSLSIQTASSSSKLGSLSRPASAQPSKVRSRENSVEDQARAKDVCQAKGVSGEKKLKADERVKRAQMQREAQEKEKLDKIEKLLKAKQEKEAAREATKQLKQEQEMQKQLKALEQKRERERKLKAELAEAAKLERDQILSKKIADEKAYLEQMRQVKKEEPKYTFDVLETDDSTDDEDTVSVNRPDRPPPPAWSLRVNAKRDIILQAGVSVNTIDKLFSCKPTTPDLAAIFPKIDSKHLQRNSSAFWNTPPRYSELPKY